MQGSQPWRLAPRSQGSPRDSRWLLGAPGASATYPTRHDPSQARQHRKNPPQGHARHPCDRLHPQRSGNGDPQGPGARTGWSAPIADRGSPPRVDASARVVIRPTSLRAVLTPLPYWIYSSAGSPMKPSAAIGMSMPDRVPFRLSRLGRAHPPEPRAVRGGRPSRRAPKRTLLQRPPIPQPIGHVPRLRATPTNHERLFARNGRCPLPRPIPTPAFVRCF